jgi:hypothetical protein
LLPFIARFRQWQRHVKRAADVWLALCPDIAALQRHDVLADCQAKPNATDLACQAGVNAVKPIKNTFEMVWRYADSLVSYPNGQHVAICIECHADMSTAR